MPSLCTEPKTRVKANHAACECCFFPSLGFSVSSGYSFCVKRFSFYTLCVWALCGVAYADDTHYQDYVIGGRSMGLGGAFAALSDDPSGVYFNPAGLVDMQSNDLQLSTNLYGYEQGNIQSNLNLPILQDVDFADLIVVPASAGFGSLIGQEPRPAARRHAYGMSVIVPSYRSFSIRSNSQDKTYYRQVTDRELWSGIGYAYKIGHGLSVGVSAYYVLRIASDREDFSERNVQNPSQAVFKVVNNNVSFVNGSVVFLVGAKYWITPSWTAGLSLRMPSIQAHSQSELFFSKGVSNPQNASGAVSTFERYETSESNSQTKYSPVLRVGTSYHKKHRMLLSADMTYHAPVSYKLVDVADPYLSRLPFSPYVKRQHVVNVNLGGEFYLIQDVSVALGFFTDFSSAPKNSSNPQRDELPHVDIFGTSLAMSYSSDHTITRVGLVYSAGKGTDVVPQTGDGFYGVSEPTTRFQKVDYIQSFLYLYVSGSFRY